MSFREKHPALFEAFFIQYVATALWASTDVDSGESLNGDYNVDHINGECLEAMKVECNDFIEQNIDLIGTNFSLAGHDFWLTRNRHGAGFWDGGWEESVGKILTERSHAFGSCDLYLADDGCLYVV